MEKSRFPNKLKSYRRCKGYSQKKVAKLLGHADTSTISKWENGLSLPNTIQLFRIAHIYGKLPQDLFENLWHCLEHEISLLALDEQAI